MSIASEMVEEIRKVYGLKSPKVFSAMLKVPRHKFVSEEYRSIAYQDGPVPIGYDQTMSQPYTVAFMTDILISSNSSISLRKRKKDKDVKDWRVLEIGTGSGYQAAVLSCLVKEVYTIEIISELAKSAKKRLDELGYSNVHVKDGDGEEGWAEHAPYDAIMITAGLEDKVPDALMSQLKVGGVLVAPIGKGQDKIMTKYIKESENKFKRSKYGIFHFVPFVGK